MLRLIDIVLILLFGFISISHFDRGLEVDLPRAGHLPRLQADFENLVLISLDEAGGIVCGMERRPAAGEEELRAWLAGEKAAGAVQVRLRADRARPSAEVALVRDLCAELDLGLTLEVIRQREEERP
ncbi:MAG: hypothetical protein Q8O14_09665 [bacterium]|jgi:biopolymer transport protein ExbD|nr:hypothetical protein [bacterium]